MPDIVYKAQTFYQFQPGPRQGEPRGPLITFSAAAKDIVKWAGVPRKGWTLRALYQRVLTPARKEEVRTFFEPGPGRTDPNTSPTSITIALMDPTLRVPVPPAQFDLTIRVPGPPDLGHPIEELSRLASQVRPMHQARLAEPASTIAAQVAEGTLSVAEAEDRLPSDDYLALFVLDLLALEMDASAFLASKQFPDVPGTDTPPDPLAHQRALLDTLFELSKPALIVDGQHRVHGAADVKGADVHFLVCALPNCSWQEQAFQFVVINEEAQPVDPTILYDIFGSSLTRPEADNVRLRLGRSGRTVEKRIAAVIAYRDKNSPFFNMVRLNVPDLPPNIRPYLSPRVIVDLIEGGRGCRGFRIDSEFLRCVVAPSLHNGDSPETWKDWQSGAWRQYWYALWSAVRDYFNTGGEALWDPGRQTNLTLGVTLRAFQDLIVSQLTRAAQSLEKQVESMRSIGVDEDKIRSFRQLHLLPQSPSDFQAKIRADYLDGFPRGFFEKEWVTGLDTSSGAEALRTVMEETWTQYVASGGSRKYPYWKNKQIFDTKKPRATRVAEEPEDGDDPA